MTDYNELIARLLRARSGSMPLTNSDLCDVETAIWDLAGEIEKLRREHDAITIAASNEEHENDALRAEIAALRKDAKRSC